MSTTMTPGARHQVEATFGIDQWDEAPTWTGGDRKITRATVVKAYHGALEAVGTMEYVMAYAPDGTARYTGIERVEGTLDSRHGSFLMEDAGTFRDGVAASAFRIIEGSGTEALTGITGSASVDAVKADTQRMRLEYELSASDT